MSLADTRLVFNTAGSPQSHGHEHRRSVFVCRGATCTECFVAFLVVAVVDILLISGAVALDVREPVVRFARLRGRLIWKRARLRARDDASSWLCTLSTIRVPSCLRRSQ